MIARYASVAGRLSLALAAGWLVAAALPAGAQDYGPPGGDPGGYGGPPDGPGYGPPDAYGPGGPGNGPDEDRQRRQRNFDDMAGGPDRGGDGAGEQSVTVGGVTRHFAIHIPANVAKPAPLVFVFHGGGGHPEAIERKTGMDSLADRNGFIVVYPAGTLRAQGRGGSWNVGAGRRTPSTSNDVAFVKALLNKVERQVPLDHARIYAAGLSMGGVFSYRLACEMSDTFAAIAAISATMVEPSCRPNSPVALLHIHGADDERIPLQGGRGDMTASNRSWPAPEQGVLAWTKLDHCPAPPKETQENELSCKTYDGCSATVEYCVMAGQGHGWPEGVSDRVWAFFASHPKTAP
jgi:polyhydroxybutyrate depolymerase